jgi:hypothetical protein
LLLGNILKLKRLHNIHTIVHAIISNGQCTHTITLDMFISITKGRNQYPIFLYQAKNNQVRKATLTVAWSEGKLASGMCFNMSFPTHSITDSGLSILTTCCINREIIIPIIVP